MLKHKFFAIAFIWAVSATCCVTGMAQKPLAIEGGKVITVSGEVLDSGTVLIRDGKIAAVGKEVEIPLEAKVIDASGKVVMPGFVEPHSSAAMSQANETNANVPYVSVLDSIDPMRPYFDSARRNGVTSVAVVPGNSTMIGGQAAVIKTGGEFVDYMVLKQDAGMKISLRPTRNNSRMAHFAALRKALDEAKRKLKEKKKADKKGDKTAKKDGQDKDETDDSKKEKEESDSSDPKKDKDDKEKKSSETKPAIKIDPELDKAMLKVVSGELPVFIYCDRAMDVGQASKLIKNYDLDAILVLGRDCHKAAKYIAKTELPVVLDSQLVYWETDPRTDEEEKFIVTELFREHDVEFAFQVGRSGNQNLGSNYLWYQAATAVKYGMPREDALKSLTTVPAKFLGVDKFVGSLEVGKDGDVVILTGDPLKNDTWVETTIVNGNVVYQRDKDEKLKLLLGETESE